MFGKVSLSFDGKNTAYKPKDNNNASLSNPVNKSKPNNNNFVHANTNTNISKNTNTNKNKNTNTNTSINTSVKKHTEKAANFNPNLTHKNPFMSSTKQSHKQIAQKHQHQHQQSSLNKKEQRKTKPIHKDYQNDKNANKNMKNFTQKQNKNQPKAKETTSQQQTLLGSKFRILNELLYSNSSQFALQYFKNNQQDYQIYHDGYRFQADKWQSKPVNIIIKHFKRNYNHYKNKVLCDLGCGQGFIQEELTKKDVTFQKDGQTLSAKNKYLFHPEKIHSFDLVSLKPFIKIADIKNLPLKNESADVVIFCLSLMGKNYLQFIKQTHRILKGRGQLIIAEVESRSDDWKAFIQMIQAVGFQLINNGVSLSSSGMQKSQKPENQEDFNNRRNKKIVENKGRYFRILHFLKRQVQENGKIRSISYKKRTFKKQDLDQLSRLLLTQCIYKKR